MTRPPFWIAFPGALLLTMLALGTARHYAPRAHVEVREVVDPAPVRSVCDWVPEHVGCPKTDWRR